MRDIKDLLDYEIYPNLDRAEAVKDLEPRDKGKYYLLTCPQCGKKEAFLYKTGIYIKCNRLNQCGHSESLWDHIQSTKGLTNQETLKELSRLAGYALPELDGHSEEKVEKARERGNALEMALSYFKAQLWTDETIDERMDEELDLHLRRTKYKRIEEAREALAYLKRRGYSEDEIRKMELGFYPSQEELEIHLLRRVNFVDLINSLGLNVKGMGDTHKVVIPYRDPVGRLKGFIVRSLLSEKVLEMKGEKKYKYNFGLTLDTLFNLHEARGQDTLILVEGYLDALVSTQRGLGGVVATGGSGLIETQLENALRYGVKSFILALDSDEAGQKGTERSLNLINRKGLKAYVITLPKGYKDPDELIRAKGIEAFRELVEKAESGARWKARSLLSKHSKQSLQTDRGRDEALREALAYEETLGDPIDSKDFVDTLMKALDIPLELLEPKLKDYHEKKTQERLEKGYRELLREGSRLLEEGKIADLKKLLDERLPDLRAKAVTRVIEPYTLQALEEDIARTRPGLKTGYESLDKLVTIPQGAITIVAGRPSHGKTTLLMNMFLKMIENEPGKAFFFFSYEESRRQVGLKLINILSGELIDERQNLIQLENYLRGNNKGRPKIEAGKEEYKAFTEAGRLWVIDEPYFVDELTDTIAYLKERHDIGAVFIDYIQKVKIKGKYQTRQLEIQKISERILETAKSLSLPIILGAQFNRQAGEEPKLDNLREGGDIEQDANLVIGLYNEAMQKAQDRDETLRDKKVDLKLTILKNRNGIVNEDVILSFDRPILTIEEKIKTVWA